MSVATGPLLAAAAAAPWAEVADLVGSGGLIVLAPHPDDETLGCGGAIAMAAAVGIRVTVVVLTDGRRSHPRSARFPGDRLARLRRREVSAALRILTAARGALRWFGHHDCALPVDSAGTEALARRVAAEAADVEATALWATWSQDPHCDHQGTAAVARAAAAICPGMTHWAYPVWGRFADVPAAGLPPRGDIFRLDTTPVRALKERALARHRSQMTGLIDDDPDGFVMAEPMQRHFLDHPEIFLRECPA